MVKAGGGCGSCGAGGGARRLLQLRLASLAAGLLALLSLVQFFNTSGSYRYPAVPLTTLDRELYKEINPKLILKKNKPDCSFKEVLSRKETLNTWEIPAQFDNFSPTGLANGSYTPADCNPQFSVAILVTYRNRQSQLDVFLPYMHNFLRRQNIHYKIYVIEQQDEKPWNKGLLYNIGAKYAMADKFPCLILHDVDLLPLDAGNLYACLVQPRHLSASVDKMRYVLTYPELVGGVLAIRADQYVTVNGFSNRYEGWGGEDDDFFDRITEEGLSVFRLPREVSRYRMWPHEHTAVNRGVWRTLGAARAAGRPGRAQDGLASARYSTLRLTRHPLFTLLAVNL